MQGKKAITQQSSVKANSSEEEEAHDIFVCTGTVQGDQE